MSETVDPYHIYRSLASEQHQVYRYEGKMTQVGWSQYINQCREDIAAGYDPNHRCTSLAEPVGERAHYRANRLVAVDA